MAQTKNFINLRGRLGRDAEVRQTGNGITVTKFSIATDYGRDEKKVTTWHNVAAYGSYAGLVKGAEVELIGRQTHTKRDDKYYAEVMAEAIFVIEAKGDRAAAPKAEGAWPGGGGDDDIPF